MDHSLINTISYHNNDEKSNKIFIFKQKKQLTSIKPESIFFGFYVCSANGEKL